MIFVKVGFKEADLLQGCLGCLFMIPEIAGGNPDLGFG